MIIDKYGMIHSGGDGGDSCHRMFTTFIRIKLLKKLGLITSTPAPFDKTASPGKTMCLLQPKKGIYIRNPDPEQWYSDPRNFSRDQMTPVICYHALAGNSTTKIEYKTAREDQWNLLKQCLKRKMFAQNIYSNWEDPRKVQVKEKIPDFINPDLWGIFARTWIKTVWFPLALPFVLIGDFTLVFAALLKVFGPLTEDGTLKFRKPGPNDVDDENINNVLQTTQYLFPTPLSWLARKIYKKFRGPNYGTLGKAAEGNEPAVPPKETNNIMGALYWYHRNDNPEIAELSRQLVARY